MNLAHATDDSEKLGGSVSEISMALNRAGVPVELHIFANGNHDFGGRQSDKPASRWKAFGLKWLRSFDLWEPRR